MGEPKLPRGTWKAATDHLDPLSAKEDAMLRHALERAMPVIGRAAVREAARQLLLLEGLANGVNCPACHRERESGPFWERGVYHDVPCRCSCGREWRAPKFEHERCHSAIKRLARGEPLPEVPALAADPLPDPEPYWER